MITQQRQQRACLFLALAKALTLSLPHRSRTRVPPPHSSTPSTALSRGSLTRSPSMSSASMGEEVVFAQELERRKRARLDKLCVSSSFRASAITDNGLARSLTLFSPHFFVCPPRFATRSTPTFSATFSTPCVLTSGKTTKPSTSGPIVPLRSMIMWIAWYYLSLAASFTTKPPCFHTSSRRSTSAKRTSTIAIPFPKIGR